MDANDTNNYKNKFIKSKTIAFWYPPLILVICILIFGLVLLNYNYLPKALLQEEEIQYPDRFIGERAQNITVRLSNIGPKVAGSRVNEVDAIEFLTTEVRRITAAANAVHKIEYDVQEASGSFSLFSMTSVYQGVQNFIVKVSPANRHTNASLLLNSHFDSVPVSIGAGDDTLMVAVMLEVLRVLTQTNETYEHSIVFLFNGAEENGLQGSHPFITQHAWAQDVSAFINLDSAGSGGQAIMFQVTPMAAWLIDYYKRSAKHPFATAVAEEMFQANFIPSDTDFRIFRDYGHISGVDMALCENGYVYHTKYDIPDIIPIETYQSVGDNVLEFARALASAHELYAPNEHSSENAVFFDFLGWFLISYSITEAIVINVLLSLVLMVGIVFSLRGFTIQSEFSYYKMAKDFGVIFAVQALSLAFGAIVVLLLALIIDASYRPLSWFSSSWLIFGVYMCPLFIGLGVGPSIYLLVYNRRAKNKLAKYQDHDDIAILRRSIQVQLFLHAHCLILILIVLILTIMGIRSAFMLMIGLIFYGMSMFTNCLSKLQERDRSWIFVHMAGQVPPFIYYSYVTIVLVVNFLPIQGRTGPSTNADTLIGCISIVMGILLAGFIIPVFCMCKKPLWILSGFGALFLLSAILMATPIGFPYRDEVSAERFWIFHTERTFHTFNGTVRKNDSGFFMLAMDRNVNHYIRDIVPNVSEALDTNEFCKTELFCGLPVYKFRDVAQARHSHWVPAGRPVLTEPAVLRLVNSSITNGVKRYNFQMSGPDHMGIYLSAMHGSSVRRWSFNQKLVPSTFEFNGRITYFIYFAYSVDSSAYDFDIDIETSDDWTVPSIDIAIAGQYIHHDELQTFEFRQFIGSFPSWSHVTPWMSSYEGYQF